MTVGRVATHLAHCLPLPIRRLAQPVRRRTIRLRRRGGILMYHRICQEPCDPWALCVPARDFEEQLAVLARRRAAIDLAAFAEETGYTRDGARLAVTFDDGYLDNLTAALPLLERYEIPATLFVVGSAIGRDREFWWDGLQRALLESGPLPGVLEFPFGSGPDNYLLDDDQLPDDEPTDQPGSPDWRADVDPPRTRRQQLFGSLWGAVVVLEPSEQDAAIDHLLSWAGQPLTPPPARVPMSPEQFAGLAEHPLLGIGSHTLDHVSLPHLSAAQQRAQIVAGQQRVEELIGRRSDRFSYPVRALLRHRPLRPPGAGHRPRLHQRPAAGHPRRRPLRTPPVARHRDGRGSVRPLAAYGVRLAQVAHAVTPRPDAGWHRRSERTLTGARWLLRLGRNSNSAPVSGCSLEPDAPLDAARSPRKLSQQVGRTNRVHFAYEMGTTGQDHRQIGRRQPAR